MLDFLIGNDFLSTIVAFGLVLIPAIIFHELGHFLAAKAVGITILEFGVGYPPRIARLFSWGETEFTLNWIPLGGFVRPLGEDMIRPLNEQETNAEREKLLSKYGQPAAGERDVVTSQSQPEPLTERQELAARGIVNLKAVNDVRPIPRIIFMVAGAVANIITALVVFVIIGFIGVARPVGARLYLDQVTPDSALALAGLQSGDFIETLNGEYFSSARELFDQLSARTGETITLGVLRVNEDGTEEEAFTTDLTVSASDAESWSGIEAHIVVNSIQENSPAFIGGVQLNDIIVSAAGVDLRPTDNPFEALQGINQTNQGKEIDLQVLREGDLVELKVTPRLNPPPGTGYLGAGVTTEFVNTSGLVFLTGPDQFEYVPLPPTEAIQYGVAQVNEVMSLILELPGRIIRGEAQAEETRVVSIVEITRIGSQLLQRSIEENRPTDILNYIALINIALGITNLLPIPPLDGGRILLVLIEMVRGRPISPEREGTILLIGIAFLLSIGVFFIINDIFNPTNLLP